MDLSKETDVQKLKALAYDQLVIIEQTQLNMQHIQARINELEKQEQTPTN